MAALPEEIITRILSFVPAKSVGRFRSVSKGWLSLLTHPDFIKSHQNALNKFQLIFFTTKSNNNYPALYSNSYNEPILKPSDFELDFKLGEFNYVQDLIICGSCNGLVLVWAKNIDFADILVLLNPTTKESMELPEFCDDYLDDYEDLELDSMHGLGSDGSGDFKVVSVFSLHGFFALSPGPMFVHIYSLKTNTWRQLTDSVDDYSCILSKREGVFLNGFIHWIVTKFVNGIGRTVILAFSLADEKFSDMKVPEGVQSIDIMSLDYCHLDVAVLGGKLALFNEMLGEIWMMNEYRIEESWTKILLNGFHEIPMVTPYRRNKPMVFHHDGKFMVANSDRMMVYDDEKKTFDETVCVWDRENFEVYGSYVESLVSIASCIEQ
uniref:F-box/kelch-repeat protein At3g06240-like n=1 Tax=Erigeron canadensis TaxID=72917 RepID=UPI001CB8DA5C|nr:F-box/kelch-repeat protein At3g06240-like [Erigeron canadensis]